MSVKIVDGDKLDAALAATADAIREATGDSEDIAFDYENETGFAAAIPSGGGGSTPVTTTLTITENGVYAPPAGVDGFSMVIAGVTARSPRCDMVTDFNWGWLRQYWGWGDDVPEEPVPVTPPPEPEPVPDPEPDPGPDPGPDPEPEPEHTSSFTTGTDAQVAALLDAAAAGTIDLQRDAGWQVGDKRLVNVNRFYGYNNVDHSSAENVYIAISAFSEYMGCGNVVQFDFCDCLTDLFQKYYSYSYNLPGLFWALPDWMILRLKMFDVLASRYRYVDGSYEKENVTIGYNYLAFRSTVEIYGNAQGVDQNEGTQLAYYQTLMRRIKKRGNAGDASGWWTRSPSGNDECFYVDSSGAIQSADASLNSSSTRLGLAPFGCLGGVSSFTTGTDADVAALIDAAAAGNIDLQQDAGWKVGDMRLIHIGAWTGGGSVAHAAEDLYIVISSFDDYNHCGNVLQFDFANCCTATQRMNATDSNAGGYDATEMYTTTLPALVEALPSWIKTRLIPFPVLASAGGSSPESIEVVTGNKLALRAQIEVNGSVHHGQEAEGTQIEYYKAPTATNKTYGKGNAPNLCWWTRSASKYYTTHFCAVRRGHNTDFALATFSAGLAPFGCLGVASSFTVGTDAEVGNLIDAAQAGTIDLQQDAGWKVGDMRLIHINAWTGGGSASHVAADVFIVISSFAEYNGCGNVLQFDFVDCCVGDQRLNSTTDTTGGYGATEMYTTTLPALVEALPSWLKTRLKTFSVVASKGGSDLSTAETVTGNKLALRAEMEIFGTRTYSQVDEGTQVDYYRTAANSTVKAEGFGGSAANWWLRSPSSATGFCLVTRLGTASHNNPNKTTFKVAPFGCL